MAKIARLKSPVRDLLDFEGGALYFDEPVDDKVTKLLEAAQTKTDKQEISLTLLRAYLLAPDSLLVLVALYRFHYFQHDFEQALVVADQAMAAAGRQLNIPGNWRDLQPADIEQAGSHAMTLVRFYLWALKGTGYLLMRLERFDEAVLPLEKLRSLDSADRLGGKTLSTLAHEKSLENQKQRIKS